MLSASSKSCPSDVASLVILFMALVMVAGLLAGTPVDQAANQTWTGTISSSHCGLSHDSASPRDCTLECVEHGASFVLVSSGRVYTFANQADERLRAQAGGTVTVTGGLHGNVITATTIVEGPQP